MGIDVQLCMANNAETDELYVECDVIDCEGLRCYPDVDPLKVGGRMDTFRTMGRCTNPDCDFVERENTAPRYCRLRVVVRA